jgi:streptogramin lyase
MLSAAPPVTEFPVAMTRSILAITHGPDGNLWFTNHHAIGRITPSGVVTEFSQGTSVPATPGEITTGPDGNLWFTDEAGAIGRITTAGVITEFSTGITAGSDPFGIAAGADGNLWFTERAGRIGRITPAGQVTEFSSIPIAPSEIAAGPDGNLWFTEDTRDRVGRITTAGVITEFSTGISVNSSPAGITAGPDGNLWFVEQGLDQIGRITPAGVVAEFSTGITAGAVPDEIAAGPDGNLWFTELVGNRIGRITPAGAVTEFSTDITTNSEPSGIAAGADGNIWFTEFTANQIGRLLPPGTFPFSDAITAAAGDDSLTLTRDADGTHLDWTSSTSRGQLPINEANGLTINGNGGNDVITLDYANGNPLPATLHLNGTFTINGLQGTNPLAATTLDVGRSTVFISYSGSDPIALIQGYLRGGYNFGAWNGTPTASSGVILSAAAQVNPNHNAGIGYADFTDVQGINSMPNTIELKYTLTGDANLDGQVNSADLQRLLSFFNTPGAWDQGDFNYDGTANSADLQALLSNFNTSLGNQALAAAANVGVATNIAGSTQTKVASPVPNGAAGSAVPSARTLPRRMLTRVREHR